ncbi:Inositol polyphosphate kinase family protein [Tritrichomonas foetus]|uniref:Kinase n=1 Tax=Tritrichomonas foetus TaxID=1144522 RepID=A0A1J4JA92_9EUKA|nr:Inositol polyphosphate kinase family protein [Tritrichomonas foetus]|eukprot:OHS95593.1 Inositol polyphosphate kinase family protein [Tritrichomonas foetus]
MLAETIVKEAALKDPIQTEQYVQYTLHRDKRAGTNLRDKVFGHPNSIISFREGLLAKKLGEGELKFYSFYRKQLNQVLPQELIPEVLGVCYITEDAKGQTSFDFTPSLKIKDKTRPPMLLQKDIAAGYVKPAILDLKIGIRTWMFGDSKEVAKRRSKKMMEGTCSVTNFRVRAAMWYSKNEKYLKYENMNSRNDNLNANVANDINNLSEGLSIVTRNFGNKCTMDELINFFKDFMKYKTTISAFIKKLDMLREALIKLRNNFGVRLYSSSILIVYDEANPEKLDLRVLDFEKSYLDVEKVAEQFNESLEECEDGIIDAVTNLMKILETISL